MRLWILWCLSVTSVVAAPDLSTVPADLALPKISPGDPAAGKRVKQVHPDWKQTKVYHLLYLPKDWQPGKRYPVIVEYAGNGPYQNRFGDISTGLPEGSKMGYGITGGRGFIWVCIPYLNADGNRNVTQWWGDKPKHDPQPTLAYCKKVVPWICRQYGGDPGAWCSVGFPEAPLPVIILACTMTKSPNCGGPLFLTATTTAYVVGAIRVQTRLRRKSACNDWARVLNLSATKARVFRPRNNI